MKKGIHRPVFTALAVAVLLSFSSCGSSCYECERGGISMTVCEDQFQSKEQFKETIANAEKSGSTCKKK